MNDTTNNAKETTMKITRIKVEAVGKVYSGKPGCMCGCKGKWRCASAHLAWANDDRGYDYTGAEVNDVQVRKVVGIINENIDRAEVNAQFAFVNVDGRDYAAYFVR